MSDALQGYVRSEQRGWRPICGSFKLTNGAATIASKNNQVGLWDVSKTGTGIYTVTFTNKYFNGNEPSIKAWLRSGSASTGVAAFAQAGVYNATTRSFPIITSTTIGTPADLAIATGPYVEFEAWFRDTVVP